MKNLHTLLFLLISFSLFATDTNPIDAPIDKVIVYQEGAQVSRLTSLSVKPGQHTLEIGSLSNQIQENSIQVSLGKSIMIEAIALKDDYKSNPELQAEIKKLQAASKVLYDSIDLKDSYLRIYSEEKTMILANHKIKGQEGLTAQSLQDFSNFYRERMMEIENKMLGLKYEKEGILKRHTKLGQEMAKIRAQQGTSLKKIEIIYSAKAAQEVTLKIKYLISEASWTPNYDVRVTSVADPLKLVYKADVMQNSGIDWTNVNIALATGYPSANLSKPVLETYYLSPNNYYQKRLKRPKRRKSNSIAGTVMDGSGLPLIGASILEHGTTNGTVTDIDGSFSLRLTSNTSKMEVSYIGFESKILEPNNEFLNIVLKEGTTLDEVVVIRGSRANSSVYHIDGVRVGGKKKTEYQVPLAIKKNVTQRIFDIDIPYTINSDGRNNKVTLLTYNIDSDYRYEIVPKVEEKAYLVASIEDWYQYELLSGNMNIYFDGIYQGDYFLDLDKVKENLQLSIGVDNNIKVSRKPSKDFKDGNFFGDKVTSKKSWDIEIYNGHPYAAAFHLVDQVPVSKTDRIDVDIKELSEGELNKDTGIVKWKKNISGKSTEKITLRYNVTAKKKDNVIVE